MPARRAMLRTAAATGVALAALLTAGPVWAHDHASTHDQTSTHEQMSTHEHATMTPSATPTAAVPGHEHDHEHGTEPVPVPDGPSDGSRALVLGGFAVANIVVVAGAALTRVAAPPRHLPRNRRS